jgi:MFS family permease
MSVTRPIGTLADVQAARRALIATFEPSTHFYLAWAVVFAVFCGSKSGVLELLGAIALPAASMAAAWWQSRRARFICPSRLRLFSHRAFIVANLFSLVGMVVALAIAGLLAAALLDPDSWVVVISHRGTPMAYVIPFVVFIVPVLAALELPWLLDPYGIDARTMRKTPDQPAVGDPVIEPRWQTIVCAMLAGVDSIDAGFLAKTLRVGEPELHQQTAELVAAQYIDVYPYYDRRWFGLTAIGRSAYRRHLRALVSTELPTVADRIP